MFGQCLLENNNHYGPETEKNIKFVVILYITFKWFFSTLKIIIIQGNIIVFVKMPVDSDNNNESKNEIYLKCHEYKL